MTTPGYFEEEVDEPPKNVDDKLADWERLSFKACGGCCCALVLFTLFSLAIHSVKIGPADAPKFAQSLLWASLSHHTTAHAEWLASTSPPPLQFGDGRGHF